MNEQHISALNDMAAIVHENAVAHGFHDFNETEGQFLTRAVANLHGEVSELWEAYRGNKLHASCDKLDTLTCAQEELADVIIRTLDMAQRLKINIGAAVVAKHNYNKNRPYRHGNKAA